LKLETVLTKKLAAVAGFFSKVDKSRRIWLVINPDWEIVKILAGM